MYVCIYIYIERERTYIYIYTHTYALSPCIHKRCFTYGTNTLGILCDIIVKYLMELCQTSMTLKQQTSRSSEPSLPSSPAKGSSNCL